MLAPAEGGKGSTTLYSSTEGDKCSTTLAPAESRPLKECKGSSTLTPAEAPPPYEYVCVTDVQTDGWRYKLK